MWGETQLEEGTINYKEKIKRSVAIARVKAYDQLYKDLKTK